MKRYLTPRPSIRTSLLGIHTWCSMWTLPRSPKSNDVTFLYLPSHPVSLTTLSILIIVRERDKKNREKSKEVGGFGDRSESWDSLPLTSLPTMITSKYMGTFYPFFIFTPNTMDRPTHRHLQPYKKGKTQNYINDVTKSYLVSGLWLITWIYKRTLWRCKSLGTNVITLWI